MKYAQINFETLQMIGSPRTLPARFTTAGGATINNFNTLDQAALYGLGWVPVTWETIENAETHKYSLSPTYDEDNKQFVYPAVAVSIILLKSEACTAIDKAAAAASSRYITVGAGQGMRYLKKLAQAEAYLAAETPNIDDYPIIKAEADAMEEDYGTRAQVIVDIATAWETIAASIEAARISGKAAVNAAEANEGVITARDTAVGTLEAI